MHIQGNRFMDQEGRTVLLRGVNLGGSTKVPFRPDGRSDKPETLLDPVNVSFVGRPFLLEEADEHFSRLRSWGMTFLRFLITWEAVEHAGPGQYDEDYLDYLVNILQVAGKHGIDVFIDPHQDVWSRWTGGDGAPAWTLEAAGIDPQLTHETGAAILHAYYEGRFPDMVWPTNSVKLGSATMFTLFFAGDFFAPKTRFEGQSIQEYLQSHYIRAMMRVAEKLKGLTHVRGFDCMNEPSRGWIGYSDLTKKEGWMFWNGPALSPWEMMRTASGASLSAPFMKTFLRGPGKLHSVQINPEHKRLWLDGRDCVWKENGVWRGEGEKAEILKPDYFAVMNGQKPDFHGVFLKSFAKRFLRELRKVSSSSIFFIEGEPLYNPVSWTEENGKNVVHAGHWYDTMTLFTKKFRPAVTMNPETRRFRFGKKSVHREFMSQIGRIVQETALQMNGMPVLIGEFGIPFDMNSKKAFFTNDFTLHKKALSMYHDVMDRYFLNYTLWNYTADNTNEFGDGWNGEDLSVYCRDQEGIYKGIHSGGRALEGFCRPYARRTAGEPLTMNFNSKTRVFLYSYRPDHSLQAPSEIFIPDVQYPHGYEVRIGGGEYEKDPEGFGILVRMASDSEEVRLRISPL